MQRQALPSSFKARWMPSSADSPSIVRDEASWAARCVDCMLALDGDIERHEAQQMATALWRLERFRARGPDAIARWLLQDSPLRP